MTPIPPELNVVSEPTKTIREMNLVELSEQLRMLGEDALNAVYQAVGGAS